MMQITKNQNPADSQNLLSLLSPNPSQPRNNLSGSTKASEGSATSQDESAFITLLSQAAKLPEKSETGILSVGPDTLEGTPQAKADAGAEEKVNQAPLDEQDQEVVANAAMLLSQLNSLVQETKPAVDQKAAEKALQKTNDGPGLQAEGSSKAGKTVNDKNVQVADGMKAEPLLAGPKFLGKGSEEAESRRGQKVLPVKAEMVPNSQGIDGSQAVRLPQVLSSKELQTKQAPTEKGSLKPSSNVVQIQNMNLDGAGAVAPFVSGDFQEVKTSHEDHLKNIGKGGDQNLLYTAPPVGQPNSSTKSAANLGALSGEEFLRVRAQGLQESNSERPTADLKRKPEQLGITVSSNEKPKVPFDPISLQTDPQSPDWGSFSDSLSGKEQLGGGASALMSNDLSRATSKEALSSEVTGHVVKGRMAQDRLSSESLFGVSAGIASLRNQKGGEIRVRLKPDNLGELQLRVQTRGNDVRLQIQASDENAKRILEESLGDLKEKLGAQNLSLSRVDVGIGSKDQVLGMSSFENSNLNSQSFGQSETQSQTLAQDHSQRGTSSGAWGEAQETRDSRSANSRGATSVQGPGLSGASGYRQNRAASGRVDVLA